MFVLGGLRLVGGFGTQTFIIVCIFSPVVNYLWASANSALTLADFLWCVYMLVCGNIIRCVHFVCSML